MTVGSGKQESKEGHKNLEDQLACPDSYPKMRDAVLKKEWQEADYRCVDCGTPVRSEESAKETWVCQNCQGQYAKPRKGKRD